MIVSLYGPNRDNPEFYVELEERISEVGFENLIAGRDWNLVLDFTLDYYNYKHLNNTKTQKQVDNSLISDLLSTSVTDVGIEAGYRTDHSIITLALTFRKLETRNRLSWKFNNSILKEKTFVNESNDVIKTNKLSYERLYSDRQVEECEISDLVEDIPTLTLQKRLYLKGKLLKMKQVLHLKIWKTIKAQDLMVLQLNF